VIDAVCEAEGMGETNRPGAKRLYCNRSRNCWLCGGRGVREQRASPKKDDPHYKVAVCPNCDLTPAPLITWPQAEPPTSG
jgi:hypothetical protein